MAATVENIDSELSKHDELKSGMINDDTVIDGTFTPESVENGTEVEIVSKDNSINSGIQAIISSHNDEKQKINNEGDVNITTKNTKVKRKRSLFRKSKKNKAGKHDISLTEVNDSMDGDKVENTVELQKGNQSQANPQEIPEAIVTDEIPSQKLNEIKPTKEAKFKKLLKKGTFKTHSTNLTQESETTNDDRNERIDDEKNTSQNDGQLQITTKDNLEDLELPLENFQAKHAKHAKRNKKLFNKVSLRNNPISEDMATQTSLETNDTGPSMIEDSLKPSQHHVEQIDGDFGDRMAENTPSRQVKGLSGSFIKKLRKLSKANKSTSTHDEHQANIINRSTEKEEQIDKEEEETEEGYSKDSFHDILLQEVKPSEKSEERFKVSSIIELENTDGGIYVGNEYLLANKPDPPSISPGFISTEEGCNDSNESDLTDVTALHDITNSCVTASDVRITTTDVNGSVPTKTAPLTDMLDHSNEYTKNSENLKPNVMGGPTQEEVQSKINTFEDALEISEEEVKETMNEVNNSKEKEEKGNLMGFVLLDRLTEKEKDKSYQIAKKAFRVYRKTQLSNAYCQTCCTMM